MTNPNLSTRAERTLQSLAGEAELVPTELRSWWMNYLRSHHRHYLDCLSFLGEGDVGKKMLEIGSVPGHFTVLLKDLGFDVRGIDIEPARLAKLWDEHRITVDKVDVEQEPLPFPRDSFDIVFFAEILEHLRLNPLHALREVYRVLAPTGRMILSTHNITPIDRLLFLLGKSYQGSPVAEFEKLEKLGHMGHIRLYSLREVREFLEHVGFRISSYARKGGIPEEWKSNWKTRGLISLYPGKDHFQSNLYMVARKALEF